MSEIEWSPWIEHDGADECPVPLDTATQVRFQDGYESNDQSTAFGWDWSSRSGVRPITHYRIPMEDYRRIYGKSDIEPDTSLQYEPNDVAFSAHSEEPMTGHDTVNAPSHYASGEIECIDAIQASMSAEEFEGHCKGSVQKYMWRWREKGGVESLRKAEWYLRKLISVVE